MPTFLPINPPKDPNDCPQWLYEALKRLNRQMESGSQGLAAVTRGEVPDGSGAPLVDLSQYFYLPGKFGGQTGYGGKAASENLVLGSTANSTKGKIYLGTASAYDETNIRLGINTTAPSTALHIVANGSGGGGSYTPNADLSAVWAGPYTGGGTPIGGTHSAALASNDGTTSYVAINTSIPNGVNREKVGLNGTILDGGTYTITASVFALSSTFTAGSILQFHLVSSSGARYVSAVYDLTGIGTTPTTITSTITCSGSVGSGTANSIELDGTGNTLYLCVSYVLVSGGGTDIARWDLASGTQSGGIDQTGRIGLGTGSTTLDAMGSFFADGATTLGLRIKASASQTADLIRLTNSSSTALSGFDASGNPYLIANAALDAVLVSDASGVGAWKSLVAHEDEFIFYEDSPVYY